MGSEQKVAVITGASQGIGADLVKAYRDRNYRVIAISRSIQPSDDDAILAVTGVELDAQEFIKIDDQFQTICPGIYAIAAAMEPLRPANPELLGFLIDGT